MIAINDYRAMVAQLKANTVQALHNSLPAQFPDANDIISHCILGVEESHLINLLKDKQGIILCGNIPGFDLQDMGATISTSNCVLFLLWKMSKDQQGTDDEFSRYARIQLIMTELLRQLRGDYLQQTMCDLGLSITGSQTIEWEYNIFGGFNGMSVGFRLKDDNGIDI